MRLIIINSNSSGNAYILENDQEALLIECGVAFDKIKKALQFNLAKVAGCIISHDHKDHCVSVKNVLNAGINIYATLGTHTEMGTSPHHRAYKIRSGISFKIGGFKIMPFDIKHDCAEPVGFLIQHSETGTILFLTDSYYSEYSFPGLNNILVEANYCEKVLQSKLDSGASPHFLRDRVIQSHMSFNTCKCLLQANDLSQVNNIVLIHLSDSNSDAKRFKKEMQELTGKAVHIAEAGLTIENFNKTPF